MILSLALGARINCAEIKNKTKSLRRLYRVVGALECPFACYGSDDKVQQSIAGMRITSDLELRVLCWEKREIHGREGN